MRLLLRCFGRSPAWVAAPSRLPGCLAVLLAGCIAIITLLLTIISIVYIYIYICICIHISLSLSLSLYIYIYTHICKYTCRYTHYTHWSYFIWLAGPGWLSLAGPGGPWLALAALPSARFHVRVLQSFQQPTFQQLKSTTIKFQLHGLISFPFKSNF